MQNWKIPNQFVFDFVHFGIDRAQNVSKNVSIVVVTYWPQQMDAVLIRYQNYFNWLYSFLKYVSGSLLS